MYQMTVPLCNSGVGLYMLVSFLFLYNNSINFITLNVGATGDSGSSGAIADWSLGVLRTSLYRVRLQYCRSRVFPVSLASYHSL